MFFTWRVLLDLIIAAIIYYKFFYPKWSQYSKFDFILRNVFYIYMVIVIALTLMPIAASLPTIFSIQYKPMNHWAFSDIVQGYGSYYKQIFLNVLMMVRYIKGYNLIKVVTYSFTFSLLIELVQPLLIGGRISDITDIITNTIGGIIGYLIASYILKLEQKRES